MPSELLSGSTRFLDALGLVVTLQAGKKKILSIGVK
jgi:hypothetical protein